ncbi:uncharacterized protein J8A68_003063 [[Candida] subhashii]|uniref:Uncharacterized protein n=1 Tax=[Candida] subhashii TaxID=561895 RepID=A0A8J5QF80_9ASCO|nr:uncharacterized protein J8A68_003063 [[Candida] subhashii]KAG7663411.1 hypothetical protein J8A68_003063 [[Candida] subhashii]
MSQLQQQIQSLPGYDIVMDYVNDYAEEHFDKIVDPYQDEQGNKRRLPNNLTTKKEQKAWKKIQSQAWTHDNCFLGSCGVGMNCGIGSASLAVFFLPMIGPLIMYAVHSRLITIAQENFNLPQKLILKLQSNIVWDLIITFPPLIGVFFGWMHGCSTRNAGLIYGYLEKMVEVRASSRGVQYVGTQRDVVNEPEFGRGGAGQQRMEYVRSDTRGSNTRGFGGRRQTNDIVVGEQQQSGFV